MPRTTLAQALASRIPQVLNLLPSDPRCVQYINESQERLLKKGKWWGTTQIIRICATSGCVTMPRQVAAVEGIIACGEPMQIHDQWFAFLPNGPGLKCSGSCGVDATDQLNAVSFDDIVAGGKHIRVYIDNANDAGKTILLQGYDDGNNYILTQNGSVRGERLILAVPYVDSVSVFSSLVGVQKDVTLGVVRVYELTPTTSAQKALGFYEWDETTPWYRRYRIWGIDKLAQAQSCQAIPITMAVKLEFIPAVNPDDYLVVGNLPAIKDMCQAIRKLENNLVADAAAYEASAINELEAELMHERGDGVALVLKTQDRYVWGAGSIESVSWP